MISKIVLPTDFSETSKNAIAYTLQLTNKHDCEYELLNAYLPPSSSPEMAVSLSEILSKESEKALFSLFEEITSDVRYEDKKITLLSKYGDVEHVVDDLMQNNQYDLVSMGTKGASGIKEILIGSNASALINKLKKPVMIIPENAKFKRIKNVLISTDYKKIGDHVLTPALELLKNETYHTYILHVHPEGELSDVKLEVEGLLFANQIKHLPHSYHFTENNKPTIGINQFIEEHHIDLVIMIKRDKSFVQKLFQESVTSKMAMHSSVPLLILHE
jgi:nucleotide-binding universal stress UspA family protein